MSKEMDRIPIGKVKRASKFIATGAKVGGNYLKHYTTGAIKGRVDQEQLDRENAKDIYRSLSELKGSALKVAQLLSMDQNVLPKVYSDQFAMAQYSAPPLSYPLVKKIFYRHFKKYPGEIFDSFSKHACNAASMGQVHKAEKNGNKLAVKVQYPGVADSIKSDLTLAKPFALKLMKVKGKEVEPFMKEVEEKLLEETDYELELRQSIAFVTCCKGLEGLSFPSYYPEFSSDQVLTMSRLEGEPIGVWMKRSHDRTTRDKLGQTLWNFYMFQMHKLRMMHADPHPGNFIIDDENRLGVIDFGCMKRIPEDFYNAYFELAKHETLENRSRVIKFFTQLEILKVDDNEKDRKTVINMFTDLIRLLSRPFNRSSFDFGDHTYFGEIHQMSERLTNDREMSRLQARGSRHFVYFNRTFFGVYHLLNAMKSNVNVDET